MVAETRPEVDVIDLQTGNIGSILKILERIGATPRCVRSPEDLSGTAPTVLPGVGNFGHAAAELARSGMRSALNDARARGVPILGICLGAQLMCLHSEEAPGHGLGWFPAAVRRFPKFSEEGIPVRVPNMGWIAVHAAPGSLPWAQPPGRMYFAHSYFIDPLDSGATVVAVSSYSGTRFATLLRDGTIMGAQFHPEKSHRYGMAFLGAWLSWASEARG